MLNSLNIFELKETDYNAIPDSIWQWVKMYLTESQHWDKKVHYSRNGTIPNKIRNPLGQ